jgi:hypothetical protein
MPGGALQSGPVSALSVVQYAGVRRAVRAHVIEATIELPRTGSDFVGGTELRESSDPIESQVIRQGDNDEKGFRDRSVGMLSCCMRAIVRSTATSAAARAGCAAPGGRFTAYAAGDI